MGVGSMRWMGAVIGTGVCAVVLGGCGSSGDASSSGDGGGSTPSPSASAADQGATGEASKPAKQVLADAKQALFKAKAVHIAGKVGSSSGGGVNLDMQFQGEDAQGRLTMAGDRVSLVKTNGKVFIKAPKSFWTKTAGAQAGPLSGRWITVNAKQVPGVANLTLQGIAASLNAGDSPLEPKTATATVGGDKAVVVSQKDGSRLYVADASPHVPLKIVSGGKTRGGLTFTGYDKTTSIKAPAGAVTPQKALKSGSSSTT